MDTGIIVRYSQSLWDKRYQALRWAFAALALFLAAVLMSFDNLDQQHIVLGETEQINNLGGRLGNWFADFMLSGFGYPAYLLPVGLAYTGWRIHENNGFSGWNRQAVLTKLPGALVILAMSSGLVSLIMTDSKTFGAAGGAVGEMVSATMTQFFSPEFSSTLLLMLLLLGLHWTTQVSWVKTIETLGRWVLTSILALRPAAAISRFGSVAGDKDSGMGDVQLSRRPVITRDPASLKLFALPMDNVGSKLKGSAASLMEKTTHVVKQKKSDKTSELSPKKKLPPPLPNTDLLSRAEHDNSPYSNKPDQVRQQALKKLLQDFGIRAEVVEVSSGPLVTRVKLALAPGVKAAQISRLGSDLLRGLAAIGFQQAASNNVRVVEVIPGQPFVGLEIPNDQFIPIYLREIVRSDEYRNSDSLLTLALGKTIEDQPFIIKLDHIHHLLMAGSAGTGISMALKTMLMSLLFKASANQVKFMLIDPNMDMLEYNGLPHLMRPIVTERKQAFAALQQCYDEMQQRSQRMIQLKTSNLTDFNNRVAKAIADGQALPDPLHTANAEAGEEETIPTLAPLPRIVCIITELSDLIMSSEQEIQSETRAMLIRLAQKGSTAGIHMIIATNQPSPDIIIAPLKSNISSRIAFQVSSVADSETILGQPGAEHLLGRGDMLYLIAGRHFLERIHGARVNNEDISQVLGFFKAVS